MMWLLALVTVLFVAYYYFKLVKTYKYWDEKGVAHEKPWFFVGNMNFNVRKIKLMHEVVLKLYKNFSKHRYVGIYHYTEPALLIRDLELIKQITVKDFDSFSDHKTFVPPDIDPLWGKNLFQMTNKHGWHSMRSTLSPSFTSSKMKTMMVLMQECSKQFNEYFKNQNKVVSIDIKDAFTRFANDIIGTTAFGIECDSMRHQNNQFYLMGKEATNFSGFRVLKFFGYGISPTLMKLLNIKVFNKSVSSFFRKTIKQALDYRKEKNIIRPDMIHLMLEAQKIQENNNTTSKQSTELSDESMTAQALIFFTAGFETVSSAMTFLAYDLAVNPDVQQKLYKEITETVTDGKRVTYETLFAMKYLDCVVSESVRLHVPVPILDRQCTKSYTIDPVLPWEKPVHLEEGSIIWIPAVALQSDDQYFPNPSKFDPERFNDENKQNILPYTYIPFGSGPRNCIGSRFALLEIKLLIVELLQNFEIVPNKKTQIPFKFNKSNFNGLPNEGVWLSLKPRILN